MGKRNPSVAGIPKTMQANAISLDAIIRLEQGLDSHEWIMERKLDGFRLVVVWDEDGDVEGYSRAGKAQNLRERLPHLYEELRGYDFTDTVFDGELSTDDDNFDHVARVMKSLPDRARRLQDTDGKLKFVWFDLLRHLGMPLLNMPLRDRLLSMDAVQPFFKPVDSYVERSELFDVSHQRILEWLEAGAEGAMLKHRDSTYVCGKRPRGAWYKFKAIEDADVIVTGYTAARHGRTGKFDGLIGAIKFGQVRDGRVVDRGQCSGMRDELRYAISANPDAYLGKVMVVRHMGIQRDGFRHPQFKGFRDDKLSEECTWDV